MKEMTIFKLISDKTGIPEPFIDIAAIIVATLVATVLKELM